MYLRIAPELYLKRLVVGGFERVFEINRNFRNEGVSPRHNPEFTMMELYMAYADYKDLIELTETLFRTLTEKVLGTSQVQYGDEVFDFGKPFEKLTMTEAIKKYRPETDLADWPTWAKRWPSPNPSASRLRRAGAGPRRDRDLRRSGGKPSDSADLHHRVPG